MKVWGRFYRSDNGNYAMRIAIVNDSIMAVECLKRILVTTDRHQVAWVARDGSEAVMRCTSDKPDLILMDLVMPVMDGVEATRQIMQKSPCAILIVTASVDGRSSKVFQAIRAGAMDVVRTPSFDINANGKEAMKLLKKIDTIERLIAMEETVTRPPASATSNKAKDKEGVLVVIGSSTGGPQALATVLSSFPESFPASVIVVQHVDAQFAPSLASWLDSRTSLPVHTIKEGDRPIPGSIQIACTNDHLIMTPERTFAYSRKPMGNVFRPSVDVFFESVARNWKGKGIGVLLTGMGRDGAKGLLALRERGWHTISQDRDSSVIYGMPKAAAELNAAVRVLPLSNIGAALLQRIAFKDVA